MNQSIKISGGLSFNKYTSSLASSTFALNPRSRSQAIITSIYLAEKLTWFKGLLDLVSVSLFRSTAP